MRNLRQAKMNPGGNSYHLMVMITRTEMGMHKNTTMKL